MLNNHYTLAIFSQVVNYLTYSKSLINIIKRRRLVKEIIISLLRCSNSNSKSLKFSTTQG